MRELVILFPCLHLLCLIMLPGWIQDYAWGHGHLPEQPGCGTGGSSAVGPYGACSPALQHWTSWLLRLVITKLGQKPKLGGVRIPTDITFTLTHFIPVVGVHTFSLYHPCLNYFSCFILVCLKYFEKIQKYVSCFFFIFLPSLNCSTKKTNKISLFFFYLLGAFSCK